ncbi:hypothetical protein MED01_002436 [Micromonospora sp. MED01]|uniref:hypothetical protein n=1 Tax=Micromonospora alfalfae TaxID=2911212 RepID=UPI001EE8CCF9|nr:hypothetical protein [Micromonospora alfalfae]MCG5464270.1 hypothetical protein [Micromonospora alfalfae]
MKKMAANLRRGDGVKLGFNDNRVVEAISFTDKPIDSHGTTGVRVQWFGRTVTSVIAADKVLDTF